MLQTCFLIVFITLHFSPEYAKYSSDEEDEEDAVLGEPFVKEREIDEQEIDKVNRCFQLIEQHGLL